MICLAAVLITLLVVTLITAGVIFMTTQSENEPELEPELEPEPLTCEEGQVESDGECMTVTYETKENLATYGRPIKRPNHSEHTLENAKDVCTTDTSCNYIVDYPRTRKQYLLLSTKNKDRGRKGVTTYVKTLTA